MKNLFNHILTILFGLFAIVFIWTVALSVPIYSRIIYYSQINQISADSGYSKQTVKTAYDEVLDYLTLHKEFGTGELACSQSAKEHFEDCRKLFDINIILLAASAICIVVLFVLASKKVIVLKKIGKFNVWFYSAIIAVTIPLVFGIIAALNFDAAFEFFHKIFFPGKTNWQFDPAVDEIINILPESYFATCGLVALGIMFCFVVGILMFEIVSAAKKSKHK